MNELPLELFRIACGLSAPLALECEGPIDSTARSAAHSFDRPFVLVGRDPSSDLALHDKQVSRRHAFIQAAAGQVFVFDLKSRTQIFWEDEAVCRTQGWLDRGQSITIGPYRIRRRGTWDISGQPGEPCGVAASEQDAAAHSDSLPTASLELPIRTSNGPSLWPVVGRIALAGRAESCQLVLTDECVSRFHAAMVRTPLGIWVVDLLAREGTHVNGERVRWAWLGDGDTLRLGSFTFIVRYETPPAQICRQDVPLQSGAAPAANPRTQLAVFAQRSDNGRDDLAIRPHDPSQRVLQAVNSSPPTTAATLVPARGEAWELASPLPQSAMAMWHRQMHLMESFHNDMIMMVQMFFAMHREHMVSAREDLDRVEQLTRELSALQAKLAETPGSPKAALTAVANRSTREARRQEPADRHKRDRDAVSDEPNQAGRPNDNRSAKQAGASGQSGRQNLSHKRPSPAAREGKSVMDDGQLHAQLTKRIAELQRERQGYWEKIMSTMNK
jgi:pSer/pThr/pTyr-binding forkhead associated (FHA) protein